MEEEPSHCVSGNRIYWEVERPANLRTRSTTKTDNKGNDHFYMNFYVRTILTLDDFPILEACH